jgi:hypothetical protein
MKEPGAYRFEELSMHGLRRPPIESLPGIRFWACAAVSHYFHDAYSGYSAMIERRAASCSAGRGFLLS